MEATIISIIGVCISAVSVMAVIYFNSKGNRHTDEKEIAERVAENTRINIKLDNISSQTREIKEQIASVVKDVQRHGERLIKVEEAIIRTDTSIKRLHGRVDHIEERLNKEEADHE